MKTSQSSLDNAERIMNNILSYLFFALCVGSFIGVVVYGAWWHIWTCGICYIMGKAMYIPKDAKEK